jgi:hypothetical protein
MEGGLGAVIDPAGRHRDRRIRETTMFLSVRAGVGLGLYPHPGKGDYLVCSQDAANLSRCADFRMRCIGDPRFLGHFHRADTSAHTAACSSSRLRSCRRHGSRCSAFPCANSGRIGRGMYLSYSNTIDAFGLVKLTSRYCGVLLLDQQRHKDRVFGTENNEIGYPPDPFGRGRHRDWLHDVARTQVHPGLTQVIGGGGAGNQGA